MPFEFPSQGTTSIFAHDGETGWQVAPLQGQLEPRMTTPGADAVAGIDQRDIEGPLVDWREKGYEPAPDGVATGEQQVRQSEAHDARFYVLGGFGTARYSGSRWRWNPSIIAA